MKFLSLVLRRIFIYFVLIGFLAVLTIEGIVKGIAVLHIFLLTGKQYDPFAFSRKLADWLSEFEIFRPVF